MNLVCSIITSYRFLVQLAFRKQVTLYIDLPRSKSLPTYSPEKSEVSQPHVPRRDCLRRPRHPRDDPRVIIAIDGSRNEKTSHPRGERFDLRGATLLWPFRPSLVRDGSIQSDTLDYDNAVPATKPTGCYPFGLQLPGPFQPRASIGSHLTQLSERRLKLY